MTEQGEFLVWDTVSMAWTEIGLGPGDYPAIAEKLKAEGVTGLHVYPADGWDGSDII